MLPGQAKSEKDSENIIKTSCTRQPERCESPEISALKFELENLNHQHEVLNEEASHYGNDESIMKAFEKIENKKSKIIKELISKLNS